MAKLSTDLQLFDMEKLSTDKWQPYCTERQYDIQRSMNGWLATTKPASTDYYLQTQIDPATSRSTLLHILGLVLAVVIYLVIREGYDLVIVLVVVELQ